MSRSARQTVEYFSDISTSFASHPVKGDIARKVNENAIVQSIKNLLLTDRYERPFQPEIGSNIRALLFENMTQFTAIQLRNEIESAIENYEPRADLISVVVNPNYDLNSFDVTIVFATINKPDPVQFNVVLKRVR